MSTLRDFIPSEVDCSDLSPQVRRYLDLSVVEEFQTTDAKGDGYSNRRFGYWMGTGHYVYCWVLLSNGRSVGFNENPSHGWSFPVASKMNTYNSLELSRHRRFTES